MDILFELNDFLKVNVVTGDELLELVLELFVGLTVFSCASSSQNSLNDILPGTTRSEFERLSTSSSSF